MIRSTLSAHGRLSVTRKRAGAADKRMSVAMLKAALVVEMLVMMCVGAQRASGVGFHAAEMGRHSSRMKKKLSRAKATWMPMMVYRKMLHALLERMRRRVRATPDLIKAIPLDQIMMLRKESLML